MSHLTLGGGDSRSGKTSAVIHFVLFFVVVFAWLILTVAVSKTGKVEKQDREAEGHGRREENGYRDTEKEAETRRGEGRQESRNAARQARKQRCGNKEAKIHGSRQGNTDTEKESHTMRTVGRWDGRESEREIHVGDRNTGIYRDTGK